MTPTPGGAAEVKGEFPESLLSVVQHLVAVISKSVSLCHRQSVSPPTRGKRSSTFDGYRRR